MLLCVVAITATARDFIVVIDPGHGGNDPGADYYGVKEKNVNLAVAKLLNEKLKNEENGIKTVMTRDKDVFIKIGDRAKIANNINADLFISIHCNALADRSKGLGASVLVMNEKQMTNLGLKYDEETRIARLENFDRSLKMSDYVLDELVNTANRTLFLKGVIQNRRDLGVIRETISPSIIVELDFLSNKQSCEFLASKDGQELLATALYNSVIKFKNYIYALDGKYDENNENEERDNNVQTPEINNTTTEITYSVQFYSSPVRLDDNDKAIQQVAKYGYSYYTGTGKFKYRYIAGKLNTLSEANKLLSKIKKLYPDAFIVKMQDGQRVYN